jgi:hypothetical protein
VVILNVTHVNTSLRRSSFLFFLSKNRLIYEDKGGKKS